MKKSYNKTFVPLLILGILISPSLAFAAPNGKGNGNEKNPNNFCTNIDATATTLAEQYSKQIKNVDGKKTERFEKLFDNRKNRDENISSKRLQNDTKHDSRINALTKRADTDVKKAAVTKFNNDIDAAIKKRQTSMDSAINTYRTGVDALINGKIGKIDSNAVVLKAAIDSAITAAKASCINKTAPKTVREVMQASIKAAHEKFRTARSDIEIKSQLKTLMETRNSSIKAAQDLFKIESEKARTDLKTAFGIK